MKFPLPSSRLRGAVLLFSCVLALLLSYLGLRNAFAAHYLELDTRAGYERAVRREPGLAGRPVPEAGRVAGAVLGRRCWQQRWRCRGLLRLGCERLP